MPPTITAAPLSSPIDTATTVAVNGLGKNQTVLLRLQSTDRHNVEWRSWDTFKANAQGTLDATKAQQQKKPYHDQMYLFNMLEPLQSIPPGKSLVYSWSNDPSAWSDPTQNPFTLTVHDASDKTFANPLATIALQRGAGVAGTLVNILPGTPGAVVQYGLSGLYFEPPAGVAKRDAAVLIFGGSEGGMNPQVQIAGGLLATYGYPALVIEYFSWDPAALPWPTFPNGLCEIPLEYFKGALDWLIAKSGAVNPFVWGTSRGSEPALLLASNYKNILGAPPTGPYANLGVIANVPTVNVMTGILQDGTPVPGKSGWTFGGEVPFDIAGQPHNPASEIPVAQIRGPIFLDGGPDFWNSDQSIHTIIKRLGLKHPTARAQWYTPATGGHGLGTLVAYLPRWASRNGGPKGIKGSLAWHLKGRTWDSNRIIDAELWPRLKTFLANNSH